MHLVFQRGMDHVMYYFEIELLVDEKLGKDLGQLLMSFLKEDPKPWVWPIEPMLNPWDSLIEVDPNDGIDLPLFAP